MFNLSKLTDEQLNKAIKLTSLLIVACVVSFAIYYVYSSYFAQSPTVTEKAIMETEKSVSRYPNNPSYRVRLGELYLNNKDTNAAVEQFDAALQLNPKHGSALSGMGMALMAKGDDNGALKHFNKEISLASKGEFAHIDDNLEKAYFYSGIINLDGKDFNKAIANFQKALKIKKTASDNHFFLGLAYYDSGDRNKAQKHFKDALMFDPAYAQAHYYLGKCYQSKGKTAQAKKEYQAAVDAKPDYTEAKKALEELD